MPKGLFRPTTTTAPETLPDDLEPTALPVALMSADDPASSELDESQGRGEIAASGEPRAARSRRRRPSLAGETKGRKLSLSDAIYDRLQLAAIQKRTTISAIAADILDRNLPRLRIERDA